MVRISDIRRQFKAMKPEHIRTEHIRTAPYARFPTRHSASEDSKVEHVIVATVYEEFPPWKTGFQSTWRKFIALSRVFLPVLDRRTEGTGNVIPQDIANGSFKPRKPTRDEKPPVFLYTRSWSRVQSAVRISLQCLSLVMRERHLNRRQMRQWCRRYGIHLRGGSIWFNGNGTGYHRLDTATQRNGTKKVAASMTEPELTPLALEDIFRFACHSKISCFNHCCRDLNQALTPYDVVRLKNHLNLSTRTFLSRFARIRSGPTTGLPVVSLRFSDQADRKCPFVTRQGCGVYAHRPASCRIYPLVRMLRRSRSSGNLVEQFALLKEPHCRGHEQTQTQTVRQWIVSQELEGYHDADDMLMELIALKNQHRPGPLPQELSELVQTAFYDLEALKEQAADGRLETMAASGLKPVAELRNDLEWLKWSMEWIKFVLFGRS
jgi:hypothetical protein